MRSLLLILLLFSGFITTAQKVIDITRWDADVIGNERMRGLTGGSIFPADQYVKVKEGTPSYSGGQCYRVAGWSELVGLLGDKSTVGGEIY